jgi:hypothetical protein
MNAAEAAMQAPLILSLGIRTEEQQIATAKPETAE